MPSSSSYLSEKYKCICGWTNHQINWQVRQQNNVIKMLNMSLNCGLFHISVDSFKPHTMTTHLPPPRPLVAFHTELLSKILNLMWQQPTNEHWLSAAEQAITQVNCYTYHLDCFCCWLFLVKPFLLLINLFSVKSVISCWVLDVFPSKTF